jgi:hypothetical protein
MMDKRRGIRPTLPASIWLRALLIGTALSLASVTVGITDADAAAKAKPVKRDYQPNPPAPRGQSRAEVDEKNIGCMSCHTDTDSRSMHAAPAVQLACVDCHGGDHTVVMPAQALRGSADYHAAMERAHVLPLYPDVWNQPGRGTPERTYTLLNKESPEFVRFINPSDYRVAREACGACHMEIIEASVRSLHATGAMLWGGASYNNGILPFKNYILGSSYDRDGVGTIVKGPVIPEDQRAAAEAAGILPQLYPLPAFETVYPGDVFRVFERGGRNITNLFPETGNPNALGVFQRVEEPGRPDLRQSNRGPGTGARIAVPLINITKTRLNDPLLWFAGTNDQPGDYRHSGCASCHVVYANDRDPRHSGSYAQYGHDGTSISVDPTIDHTESGRPLVHSFTRAIPTSQCMICHMHQPNMFMNSFLGYTMWDYEADAPSMWPKEQQYPSHARKREVLDRNPEGAAPRGNWADVAFLKMVADLNPQLNDTQFADYHGHGWNFRAIFKRDRRGNLLDADGNMVADDDPDKFQKAVHMSSIHVDVGMHCVDCHLAQDNHGSGHIYGEVALAIEIQCKDCHGTARDYPNLYTSGPAALDGGTDMAVLRTPDGRRRFEWSGGALYQRSMMDPDLEWKMSLVKDSVTSGHAEFNEKAARAKLMRRDTSRQNWGPDLPAEMLAHDDESMECYACHTSWTTSCGGCHLPIEANWKTDRHHYEGGETRNWASYNPQVARDDMFLLGRHSPAKGAKIAPTRSSSALVLSSTNANREKIYIQQPPVAASGFSSQAFNPHYPHTERRTETKTCTDCHLSEANDNNAIMAQLLMFGTNFINFVGFNAWVGGDGEVSAVQVTEWDEPQAVIGSYLHRYAYPDWFRDHQERGRELETAHRHRSGTARCVQLRGEYLYVAEGRSGMRVYDVASIANKGYSQRIVTAPFSPLGHDTRIRSRDARCVVLPTNQPIHPDRNDGELMRVINQEQPFHPIYNYAIIIDAVEGIILTDVNTLQDGEPRNNRLTRAITWNPNGILNGARHAAFGGRYLYITTDRALVVADFDLPLRPSVVAQLPLNDPRAAALQFRYLFVTDADGLKVIDVTDPTAPVLTTNNTVPIADARGVFVARTYAYVAAGAEGIVIVDVENPARMHEYQRYNGGGALVDSTDVIVASTNASLFAYVADGRGGLKVLQLTSPGSQPKFYGFSPEPKPEVIARYPTRRPALSLSRGLERDRAVDETGGQVAVFGRLGSRPFDREELRRMYLNADGQPWFVSDDPQAPARTADRAAEPRQ